MELIKTEAQVTLEDHFAPFEAQAKEWLGRAREITVTDSSQKELMQSAREARLALRGIRISVEKKHKELKEDALRYSQSLDGIKRKLVGLIEPIEKHLQEQEDFEKRQIEIAKTELRNKRAIALGPFMSFEYAIMNFPHLAEMEEEAFNNMLEGFRLAKEKRQKDEEAQRIADEKKRKEDEATRKKLETENAELKKKVEKEEQRKKDEAAEKRRLNRAPDKDKMMHYASQLAEIKAPLIQDPDVKAILLQAQAHVQKAISLIVIESRKL
jgi:hypothetical protein